MPLLKSVPNTTPEPITPKDSSPPPATVTSPKDIGWEGVPLEIYRFFNLPIPTADSKDIGQIKTIYKWASNETESTGDAMLKIRELERKLGTPAIGETRFTKLWNWIAIDLHCKELEKRKEAYIGRTNG